MVHRRTQSGPKDVETKKQPPMPDQFWGPASSSFSAGFVRATTTFLPWALLLGKTNPGGVPSPSPLTHLGKEMLTV